MLSKVTFFAKQLTLRHHICMVLSLILFFINSHAEAQQPPIIGCSEALSDSITRNGTASTIVQHREIDVPVTVNYNNQVKQLLLATMANASFLNALDSGFDSAPIIAMPELDGSMDSHANSLNIFNKTGGQHHPILQVDLIGQGKTYDKNGPINTDKLDVQVQVEALRQLMSYYNIREAHFVGFSYSGGVAQAFAHQHPEMVTELTLFAPYTRPISRMLRSDLEDLYVQLGDRILLPDREWPEIRRRNLARMVRGIFEYDFVKLAQQDDLPPNMRFQVNIITASNDNVTPTEDHTDLVSAYKTRISPHAQLKRLDGVGHRIPRSAPQESATSLLHFLSDEFND